MADAELYEPSTALDLYHANRSRTAASRLWARERLLHQLGDLGLVEFFEGPGDNPTVLTGYGSSRYWLRANAGLTTSAGEVRRWNGDSPQSSLANWPLSSSFPPGGEISASVAAALAAQELAEAAAAAAAAAAEDAGGGGGITLGDVISGLYSNGLRPVELVDALPTTDLVEGRPVYYSGVLYIYKDSSWQNFFDALTPDAPTGIEVFSTAPTTGNYEDRVYFDTTEKKLFQYVSGAYVQVVEPTGVAAEVADGSITVAKFAANIAAPTIVSSLPTTGNYAGRLVFLTSDNKLYRHTGSPSGSAGFTTATAASDLSGQIASGQLAANSVTAGTIAAAAISATEIAADAITTAKIAADAITTAKIAALAITAAKIATDAITADKIAANTITAGKIQAGAIGATQIATGAITATKLASDSVTAAAIQAGVISTEKLAAGSVTAAKIAAGAVDGTVITGATVRTGSGSTRVEMDAGTNALNCYVSGTAVAKFGNVSASGLVFVQGAFSGTYPAYFENTNASGGTVQIKSTGGYAAEIQNTSSAAGVYGATIRNTTGGFAALGASSGAGGYAGLAVAGTWHPFTGSHGGLLAKTETSVAVGDILVDGDLVGAPTVSDSIHYAVKTTTVADSGAIGVYVNRYVLTDDMLLPALGLCGLAGTDLYISESDWGVLKTTHDCCTINSVGEGGINVCGRNGNIAKGDLIVTSSLAGKGQKQGDDIVRSSTVARSREACTFATPDEVKMISCIYVCG